MFPRKYSVQGLHYLEEALVTAIELQHDTEALELANQIHENRHYPPYLGTLNQQGKSFLHMALESELPNLAIQLLEKAAGFIDSNVIYTLDINKHSIIWYAAENNYVEFLRKYFELADPRKDDYKNLLQVDNSGMSILHIACKNPSSDLIYLLLENIKSLLLEIIKKVKDYKLEQFVSALEQFVNAPDAQGNTALHYAFKSLTNEENQRPSIEDVAKTLKLFLENNANLTLHNNNQETPLDCFAALSAEIQNEILVHLYHEQQETSNVNVANVTKEKNSKAEEENESVQTLELKGGENSKAEEENDSKKESKLKYEKLQAYEVGKQKEKAELEKKKINQKFLAELQTYILDHPNHQNVESLKNLHKKYSGMHDLKSLLMSHLNFNDQIKRIHYTHTEHETVKEEVEKVVNEVPEKIIINVPVYIIDPVTYQNKPKINTSIRILPEEFIASAPGYIKKLAENDLVETKLEDRTFDPLDADRVSLSMLISSINILLDNLRKRPTHAESRKVPKAGLAVLFICLVGLGIEGYFIGKTRELSVAKQYGRELDVYLSLAILFGLFSLISESWGLYYSAKSIHNAYKTIIRTENKVNHSEFQILYNAMTEIIQKLEEIERNNGLANFPVDPQDLTNLKEEGKNLLFNNLITKVIRVFSLSSDILDDLILDLNTNKKPLNLQFFADKRPKDIVFKSIKEQKQEDQQQVEHVLIDMPNEDNKSSPIPQRILKIEGQREINSDYDSSSDEEQPLIRRKY